MLPARLSHTLLVMGVALAISSLFSLWGRSAALPINDCVSCDAGWYQRIAEEGYNLNISRYMSTAVTEVEIRSEETHWLRCLAVR